MAANPLVKPQQELELHSSISKGGKEFEHVSLRTSDVMWGEPYLVVVREMEGLYVSEECKVVGQCNNVIPP